MRESKFLEFKENISNTFLKTVSAYANFGTGVILFGISDDGTEKGLSDPIKCCLDIENRINDSISPIPVYSMEVIEKTSVIRLTVQEGLHKPYLYKAKAYRRNDSATIEVDRLELTRLILEGQDISFEELPSKLKDLKFEVLSKKLKTVLELQDVTEDTLKTLELTKPGQEINIAGELLADRNSFSGIDIVRFGNSISTILDRETYEHVSILEQYDKALALYRKYYQYEQIKGAVRESIFLIPEEAYREAIANALVHRQWDVASHISVSMFPDRIEITSPGGLPKGMHEEEYYRGGISILRNRIIGTVFLRLGMIERFGTGIRRINETYLNSDKKPIYSISENSIRVLLPVIKEHNSLTDDENKVLELVKGRVMSSSAIVEATGFGKSKVVIILNKLVSEGYIHSIGNGRGKKYTDS